MAKFKVEVGGFVSTFNRHEDNFVSRFRLRTLIIYAKSEEEAKEKALDKFYDLSQRKTGNMVSHAQVDSIEKLNNDK